MDIDSIEWEDDVRYIDSNSEEIPDKAGIYKILRDDGEKGKYTRVYVGKTESLKQRYGEHLSENEINLCIKKNLKNSVCYFRYAIVSKEEDRQDLEDALLKNGKYECNMQGQ